jgi:hypothetical protein
VELAEGRELAESDVLGDAELVSELLGEADCELLGDVVKSLGLTVAEALAAGVQVARSGSAFLVVAAFAELVLVSGTELGIGTSAPVGSDALGNTQLGSGEAVPVGQLVGSAAVAGHVLASSMAWICVWPLTVSTVAEAAVSCAPGMLAT